MREKMAAGFSGWSIRKKLMSLKLLIKTLEVQKKLQSSVIVGV